MFSRELPQELLCQDLSQSVFASAYLRSQFSQGTVFPYILRKSERAGVEAPSVKRNEQQAFERIREIAAWASSLVAGILMRNG